ncbi:MAG: hypothetical protein ACOC8E_04665 [Planctomycetota bacterium]
MRARDVATVACKVLAVCALLIALDMSAHVISFLRSLLAGGRGIPWSLLLWVLPLMFAGIMAWVLWCRADWIAARMLPKGEPGELNLGADWHRHTEDATTLALATAGLLIVLWQIPSILQYALLPVFQRLMNPDAPGGTMSAYAVGLLTALLARAAVGVGLLFGARHIAHFIHWLRVVGRRPPKNEEAT